MELQRKKLAELRTLYSLEPTLRDVFVEGSFDLGIIRWFLGQKNFQNVGVYEIGMVEIPDGEVLASGRKANNRERLVFLAEYAENCLGKDQKQITCIVDRDFAAFLDTVSNFACLLYTDHSCMEMYVFDKLTLGKFFTIGCNRFDWPTDEIMATLSVVLQELYLLRLANEALDWRMAFLDGLPCMRVVGWSIDFDAKDFLQRYLNKNGRMAALEAFSDCLNFFRNKLTAEVRNQLHGHDFVEVLCWFLRQKGVQGPIANAKTVGRQLALCLEVNRLGDTSLFNLLWRRVNG